MKSENQYHYSVTIPLMPGNPNDWQTYLDGCLRINAKRVFLFTPLDNICRTPVAVKKQYGSEEILEAYPYQESCDIPSLELYQIWADEYRDKAAIFEEKGIEAAFWIGETIGHGGGIAASKSPFQQLTGPEGMEAEGCNCPLDENFLQYMEKVFTIIASTGTPLILLDDDFRLNYHLPNVPIGCFCPLHIEKFNRKNNTNYTRVEIVSIVYSPEPNAERTLWYDMAADSLMQLAKRIERTVHSIHAGTRIGLATAMTHWSSEGVDIVELTEALAGDTQPFVRTFGSPYRSENKISHIGRITEFTNLQLTTLLRKNIEVLAEGDTYPHTRYFCPAQMLHSYEQSLQALHFPGILTYPVPFSASAGHETGYFDITATYQTNYRAIREVFHKDLHASGVYPLWKPNNIRAMRLPDPLMNRKSVWPDEPTGLYFLSRMGIPIDNREGNGPTLASGQGLAALETSQIDTLMDNGIILDSVGATILFEKGFDVGIESIQICKEPRFEHFTDKDFSGKHRGEIIWLLTGGNETYSLIRPHKNSKVISEFYGNGKETWPSAILYENKKNQRIVIFAFDFFLADKGMQLLYNYARQEQFTRCCAWVGKKALTATANGYPDLHLICQISENNKEVVIGIQNTHLDTITDIVLRLSPEVEIGKTIMILYPDTDTGIETDRFLYTKDEQYGYLKIYGDILPMRFLSIRI